MRATSGRSAGKFSTLVLLALLSAVLADDCGPVRGATPSPAPGMRAVPTASILLAQSSKRRRKKGSSPVQGVPQWAFITAIVMGVLGLVLVAVIVSRSQKKKTSETGGAADTLGSYRLLNLMQTGQTSQVWEAAHTSSNLHFAIKMLLPEHAEDSTQRDFLFHEADVGMQLKHPNVIHVVSVHKDKKRPHFVMDFFPGGSLKMRIMHKETDFIKEHAQEILKQTATALAFMNAQGFVHRDVKPDNILVNSSGEVRLIDFALVQKIGLRLRKGAIQGTRSYMSPEQIRNESLDGRADIYSFGATVYELFTGRPPFRAANPQELLNKQLYEAPITPRSHNPEITEELADLILKMLSKKKEDRPNNFHEVLMAMKKIRFFKIEAARKSGQAQ
jgi:serine/threonine protein kinase